MGDAFHPSPRPADPAVSSPPPAAVPPAAVPPAATRSFTTFFHRFSERGRRVFALGTATAAVVGALLATGYAADRPPAAPPEMFAHAVFFTLEEPSAANRDALVAACRTYLTGHDGTVFFAAGPRAEEARRDVNDTDFDVSLLIVFESDAAHEKYQTAPRHLQFIAEQKAAWKTVRVFDAHTPAE